MKIEEKEMIEVVDENGEATGMILEKKEMHDKNLLHNEVACLIINDKGQTLMQKRSANKRFHPNKWAICAGHVDAGEKLKHAMQREIEEEIGIKVEQKDIIPLEGYEKEVKRREKNSHISYLYYMKLNNSESDFVIQEEELSEVKWINIDDVISMIRNNKENIVFGEDKIEIFESLKKL